MMVVHTEVLVAIIAGVAMVLAAVIPPLLQIRKELRPNGGATVKDTVHRIEATLTLEQEKASLFRHDMRNDFNAFVNESRSDRALLHRRLDELERSVN